MDLIVLTAVAAVGVVLIVAAAAVVIVWITVARAESTDLPIVLDSIAKVIYAIRGKR